MAVELKSPNFAAKHLYNTTMTDYDYIMEQCKKYHFTKWDDNVLKECQEVLPNLSREQLISLYRCRLLEEKHPLKQTVFKVLFANKIGIRERRIKTESIDALIQEFRDQKGGNVALARKELRERYKAGRDKQIIESVFNSSTKSDQQWIKSQIRKERYGGVVNNYQWKK